MKMNKKSKLRLFGMNNLLLESELNKIENSGIEIGHLQTMQKNDDVVDIELFELDIRKQAKKMANFYVYYYCVENTVRRLISERLFEKHKSDWWTLKVPETIRTNVAEKQKKERDTMMSIRSEEPIYYTDFGELIDILFANWEDFSDTIRSKKAMQQVLYQFNLIRNVIAHSCELEDDEIKRLELLVKDWQRIQT